MTLKYNQGHLKWYEWAKFIEYYHHAKFDHYHFYIVWENHDVKVVATYNRPAGWLNTDHYTESHFSRETKKLTENV